MPCAAATRTGHYFATARPEPAFAHTSPVYLSMPGTVPYSVEDRRYLSDWIGLTLEAVRTQTERPRTEVKRRVAAYAAAAERLQRRLFAQSDLVDFWMDAATCDECTSDDRRDRLA